MIGAEGRSRGLDALVVLTFLAVSVALFAPALFGDDVFFPLHTRQMEPWRSDTDADEVARLDALSTPVSTDKNFLFHPDTEQMVETWRDGRVPTWNPALLGGVSQLGQALFGAFYPPRLVLLIAPNLVDGYAWSAVLHVFLAALGTYGLLRAWRLSRGASAVGALLFALSGPMAVRFHYYMTFEPVVWIPWFGWFLTRFVQRPTAWRWSCLPWPVAFVFLTGFPQTGLYGLALAIGVASAALLRQGRSGLRPLLALLIACGLGAALTAPQVLPVLETQSRSLPRPKSVDTLIETAGSPWLPAGYVAPSPFVDARVPETAQWTTNPLWSAFYARVDEATGTALPNVRLQPSPNLIEDGCYAGALGLLLAMGALASRRRHAVAGLLLLTAGCWAYAMGWPPLIRATYPLPGGDMGDVRRILPTTALLVALLAAFGADACRRTRALPSLLLAVIFALGLAAAWWSLNRLTPDELWSHLATLIQERTGRAIPPNQDAANATWHLLQSQTSRALIAFGCAVGALCLLAFGRSRSIGFVVVGVVAVADLATLHHDTNPFLPKEGFLEPHPLIQAIADDADGTRLHRYASTPTPSPLRDVVLPNNLSLHYGLEDAAGYIVAVPSRYARYLRALQPEPDHVSTVLVRPLGPNADGAPTALASPLLPLASIRHVLTRDDLGAALRAHGLDDQPWTRLASSNGNQVWRHDGALPFATVHDSARFVPAPSPDDEPAAHAAILQSLIAQPGVVCEATTARAEMEVALGESAPARVLSWSRTNARVDVELEPGNAGVDVLYLTHGFDVGWSATVDGVDQPILPANVAFQAVLLPEGARHVTLTYRQPGLALGVKAAATALGLIVSVLLVAGVRRLRAR